MNIKFSEILKLKTMTDHHNWANLVCFEIFHFSCDGDLSRKSPYSVLMREDADQKNLNTDTFYVVHV